MLRMESWAFMCLIGSPVLVTLSMTVVTGGWSIAVGIVAALVGILSGCLYAVSAQQRR
jgi:membrane associated rhomboid family serine protease